MFTDSRGYSFSDWQWTQTKQDSRIVPQLLATNEQDWEVTHYLVTH